MNTSQVRQFTSDFIEEIWNLQNFDNMDVYLHPEYVDHSLPDTLPANREGLKQWVRATSHSFLHKTIIQDQVVEAEKIVLKIEMRLTHIGKWREIDPTGVTVSTTGYRFYHLKDNKIIAHWGAIDGTAIESQLRKAAVAGCKIQP